MFHLKTVAECTTRLITTLRQSSLQLFFAELAYKIFGSQLQGRERLTSFTGLLCGHPAGGIRRLQRIQAPRCLNLLPIPREVGRYSRVFWCHTAFGCSPINCLSEEKTGTSLKSQDRVRALLTVCVRLECSKFGSSFISALIWGLS